MVDELPDSPLASIRFDDDDVAGIKELTELYEAVGWITYAADPDALARAVDRSSRVVTARAADDELIGLARCLTDEVHTLHVEDVIVHPDHHRIGIGTVLVGRLLGHYPAVEQPVAATDPDDEAAAAFLSALGFIDDGDGQRVWHRPRS